jgi:hemerythrin
LGKAPACPYAGVIPSVRGHIYKPIKNHYSDLRQTVYFLEDFMNYEWNGSFATGVEQIDSQHKELIVKINTLLNNCANKTTEEELTKSLDFLVEYTIQHFFDEEQLQQKYGYPDYPHHKKLHDDFKKTVRDFKAQLIMKGASDELSNDVQQIIGSWLINHIKGQDMLLGRYIKRKLANI